jgi:hypothetical protein
LIETAFFALINQLFPDMAAILQLFSDYLLTSQGRFFLVLAQSGSASRIPLLGEQ